MKISFNCNNGAFQSPGGGEVLLLKTKEFLTKDKEFVKKYGLKDFVLYVGRIDSRKNVLVLIKIMNKLNLPLVIIGNSLPHQIGYYNMCRRIAKKNVYFLGKINHESSLLESAYAA